VEVQESLFKMGQELKDLKTKFKEDQKFIDDGMGELLGLVESALISVKGSVDSKQEMPRTSPFKRGLQEKLA